MLNLTEEQHNIEIQQNLRYWKKNQYYQKFIKYFTIL